MLTRRNVVSGGVNLADRWLEDYSLGATGRGIGCEHEKVSVEGVWVPLLCSKPRTVSGRGIFQDDVFVSGLKDGSTQPVVVIMLGSLGRRRKRRRADWGTGSLFLAPKSSHCRGLLKYTPCPSFRNALSNTTKKHGELLGWGLIGASRLVCRIQRRTISIRNPKDVLVTKAL